MSFTEILMNFCSRERQRYALEAPFTNPGLRVYSDGKTAVFINDETISEKSEYSPDFEKVKKQYWDKYENCDFIELKHDVKTKLVKCPTCNGEKAYICSECEGNGYVTCSECGHDNECKECDGDGSIECEECDDNGMCDEETYVKINDYFFPNKHVYFACQLPGMKFHLVFIDDDEGYLIGKWESGGFILFGVKSTAGCEITANYRVPESEYIPVSVAEKNA